MCNDQKKGAFWGVWLPQVHGRKKQIVQMPDVFTVHEFWNIFDINRQAKVELVLKLCLTVSQITQQDDSQMLD